MKHTIAEFKSLLKSFGFKYISPKSQAAPTPYPENGAVFEKPNKANDEAYQVGVYADGSWDVTADFDGIDVTCGKGYSALQQHLQKLRTQVWGCLYLRNGNQIELNGQPLASVKVKASQIAHYGEQELGAEANVLFINATGKQKVVTGLQNVRKLFANNKKQ